MNALQTSVPKSAPPGLAGAAAEPTQQYITFTLDPEEYGVDIMMVGEI